MESFIENLLNGKKSKKSAVDQLYKIPQKDKNGDQTTFPYIAPNYVQQADLLYLPNDQGNQYALIVVDQGSRLVDAQALQNRSVPDIIDAFKEIYKRKILKKPKVIVTDSGSEFRSTFDKEMEKMGIISHKTAKVGRHRSVALAERKNLTIGKIIHKILVQTELNSGNPSSKWVSYLPLVIKLINKAVKEVLKKKEEKSSDEIIPITSNPDHKIDLLQTGDRVRVALDNPIDASGKPLNNKFRASDIRFNPTIRTVTQMIAKPNEPIMYLLNGNKMNDLHSEPVAYTRNQLQKVSNQERQNETPLIDNEDNRFEVQKVLERRKKGNSFEYLIKWKGYRETTWEKKADLIKDIPQLIARFDKKVE